MNKPGSDIDFVGGLVAMIVLAFVIGLAVYTSKAQAVVVAPRAVIVPRPVFVAPKPAVVTPKPATVAPVVKASPKPSTTTTSSTPVVIPPRSSSPVCTEDRKKAKQC